ncbi:MAG TPA: NAD-dependent epimerase/dehydratase family protein [Candidatus Sulfotelmatobacter sp.]|jgi:UDP-glucose 4-epimerase|nr:NAD-dependent epimerase/dehydratase family protein [Candidatus Sulfotelmatobacter sp.]
MAETEGLSNKSVLVTGAGGFIGKHLVRELLQRGIEVGGVDKIPWPKDFAVSSKLSYLQADVNSTISRWRASPGMKIVHLAAITSVQESVRKPLATVRANIGATCRMLDLARKIDSERFVFASTAAIYGDKRSSSRETDTPAPASPYAVSKLASEYYCKIYSSLYGIPTVVLRYFNVYGPGQSNHYAGVITRFVKEVLRGKPPVIFGDGTQTRDFVFIDDVIRATVDCLTKRVIGGTILNIGTGRSTSITLLARRILYLFDLKNLQPIQASPRVGDLKNSKANISAAQTMIGFRPRYQLAQGLLPTIEWFRRRKSQ